MEKEFPKEFYRGISSPNDITKEGYIMAAVFKFDKYDEIARNDDGFCELSINWNDDEGALTTLLRQHKPHKEEKQFKGGYCKISKSAMDLIFKPYIDGEQFKYERRPILGNCDADISPNPYHGNLLMLNELDKNIKKNIQHTLATLAGSYTSRSDNKD